MGLVKLSDSWTANTPVDSANEALGLRFLDSHFKSCYDEGYFQYWMDELKRALPPVQQGT